MSDSKKQMNDFNSKVIVPNQNIAYKGEMNPYLLGKWGC